MSPNGSTLHSTVCLVAGFCKITTRETAPQPPSMSRNIERAIRPATNSISSTYRFMMVSIRYIRSVSQSGFMPCLPSSDGTHSHTTGCRYIPFSDDDDNHRLARDRATVTPTAVEHQQRPVVLHELRPRVRHDESSLQVAYVRRDHPDAVTIVAHQVRAHQMVGDQAGFRCRASARRQNGADQASQVVGSRTHAIPPSSFRLAFRARADRGAAGSGRRWASCPCRPP